MILILPLTLIDACDRSRPQAEAVKAGPVKNDPVKTSREKLQPRGLARKRAVIWDNLTSGCEPETRP